MRPKIVIPVLLLGVLAIVALLWLRPRRDRRLPEPAAPNTPVEPAGPLETAAPAMARPVEVLPAVEAPGSNSVAAQHESYVAERCAELEDLATEDQPEALASILGELTNRDPAIRQAAIHAAMEFGSREAIPKLLEAVNQTEDEEEKVALLQAIKYLKLPTLSELAEQGKTNAVAGRQ